MNVSAGFNTGFAFFYTSPSNSGTVNVYDGLNATGTLLAALVFPANGGDCAGDPNGQPFCNFTNFGVTFAGIARSVDFGGAANFVAFDNITLGSDIAGTGAVPEPATWAMMLVGFGAMGVSLRRRKRAVARQVA